MLKKNESKINHASDHNGHNNKINCITNSLAHSSNSNNIGVAENYFNNEADDFEDCFILSSN